jgi:hypothetical protein
MFATPYFVYVHVPKTGGYFVRDVAARHFEIVWSAEQFPGDPRIHAAYETLPAEYRHLPAISFVRNPWAWYVSSWAWMRARDTERSPMGRAAKNGFKSFVQTGVAQAGGYPATFARISHGTETGRFERMQQELLSFFERQGIPTTHELERDLVTSLPVNTSDHGPYRDYYDDETRELVAVKCREIVETFGYTF